MSKKLKIEINSIENLRQLLQETYELADSQIIQSQNEINKLAASTKLQDEIMPAKKAYASAINDYLTIKDKAISKKIEIAKLMAEMCKINNNANNQMTEMATSFGSFDFDNIRNILDKEETNKTESIKLNK